MVNQKRLLKALGLDERALRIYSILIEQGPLTAREIAEKTNMPYTKVYEYLRELQEWGLIEQGGSRPAKFSAKPPLEVYRGLASMASAFLRSLREQFEFLQSVYESSHGSASTTFIALIRGDKVLSLSEEIIRYSDGVVYAALSYPELMTAGIVEAIRDESKRIEIKVLATKRLADYLDLPPRVEVRVLEDMFGGGVLGNSAILVVKYSGGLLGIHGNEKYLLDIAKTYFNYLWDKAEPIRRGAQ